MGIGSRTLQQFIEFKKEGFFDNIKSVMDMGSQEIFCEGEEKAVKNFFEAFGVQHVSREDIAEIAGRGSAKGVYEQLGFSYNCIDVDGQFGALALDLNYEDVPESHKGVYDFVTNFGTTEHVANQLNCFKVMHDLTKPGGYMYHELICTGWLNHGLVNYNPKMFWMLCKSNFYDYEGMWFWANTEQPEKLPENIVQMSRKIEPKTLNEFSTQTAMIGVLMRKVFDVPFVPPLDGDLAGTTEDQRTRYWTVCDPEAYNKLSHLRYQIGPFLPNGERVSLGQITDLETCKEDELKIQLNEAESEIEAMKTSKFWKLRTQWFKLKELIGLNAK